MKNGYQAIRGILLLTLCFGFVPLLSAQSTNILFGAPASWLRLLEWKSPTRTVRNEASDGTRYLLYERQENPATKEQFTRIVVLMENEAGVQDSGSLTFSFDSAFEELILHRVQIHRQGRSLDRLDRSKIKVIQPEEELEDHMITGEQRALLFVEDLRVGDALEYSYTVRGSNPIMAGHFYSRFVIQSTMPVDKQRYRVLWPSSRTLHIRQHLTSASPSKSTSDGGTEYVWDFDELPGIPWEDYQPASHEPYPYLELCDFDTWERVVEWALPLYTFEGTNMPEELAELIAEWKKVPQAEERARRALQFIQDELRYTALELGPDSYRPIHPFETFRTRYGDCKGKVSLLCLALKEMGITAYPALVNTSVRQAVANRLPSPFAFNHVIVKIELDGKVAWVDPTASHQGGSLWKRYVYPYRKTLVIKPGVNALENIPEQVSDRAYQRVVSTFRLKDYDSPVSLNIETSYESHKADYIREYFARNETQETAKAYLNYYARYYPGIEEARPLTIDDDRQRNVVKVRESYQIKGLWETNETDGQLQAYFYVESMENVLTDPDTRLRKMPLRITYPLHCEQENIVHLPDGDWDIPELEDKVEHEAFSFRCERKHSGKIVRFKYECRTKGGEISPESVPGYLKKMEEMDDLVGDTLYRPDDSLAGVLKRINWLMVILAGFVTVVAFGCAVALLYVTRGSSATATMPPPLPFESRLQGLGGWLVLVGIGLCLAPFIDIAYIASGFEGFFFMDAWQAVTSPQAEDYHPLWGPLLVFELTGTIVLFWWNLVAIIWFFGKRRYFPRVYILLLVADALFLILDAIGCSIIPYLSNDPEGTGALDAGLAIIGAAIWICYTLRSRRVKLTFVK